MLFDRLNYTIIFLEAPNWKGGQKKDLIIIRYQGHWKYGRMHYFCGPPKHTNILDFYLLCPRSLDKFSIQNLLPVVQALNIWPAREIGSCMRNGSYYMIGSAKYVNNIHMHLLLHQFFLKIPRRKKEQRKKMKTIPSHSKIISNKAIPVNWEWRETFVNVQNTLIAVTSKGKRNLGIVFQKP